MGDISFKTPHLPLEMKETVSSSQASGIPEFFVLLGQTSVFEDDHTSDLGPVPSLVQMHLEFLSLRI